MKSISTHLKRTVLFVLIAFTAVYAQSPATGEAETAAAKCEHGFSVSYGADLVSRYIWRGIEFGQGAGNTFTPHFQPTAALTYTLGCAGSLSYGFWGSYGFDGSYDENDMYLSYAVELPAGALSLTFNDYYYPYLGIPFSNTDGDGKGAHTIDAQLGYTFPERFPLSVTISNNIHNDVPDNKSLYCEVSYPFQVSEHSGSIFIGAAKGPSVWHAVTTEKFELINVGFKLAKTIKITESFSVPTGIAWIYNAHQKKTYLVFKLTL